MTQETQDDAPRIGDIYVNRDDTGRVKIVNIYTDPEDGSFVVIFRWVANDKLMSPEAMLLSLFLKFYPRRDLQTKP